LLTGVTFRNRITWAKATRHLWTKEEGELFLEQRRKMSAKLDPAQNLPSWCKSDEGEASPDEECMDQSGPE
jgi:hypothetical protein